MIPWVNFLFLKEEKKNTFKKLNLLENCKIHIVGTLQVAGRQKQLPFDLGKETVGNFAIFLVEFKKKLLAFDYS